MIKPIKYSDLSEDFRKQAEKERISFLDGDNVHYWGAYKNDQLIGCTSLVIYKNGHGKIKSNYVLKDFRGLGVFRQLNESCLAFAREKGVTNITLNCLPESAEIHKQFGAVQYQESKTIKYLVYRL